MCLILLMNKYKTINSPLLRQALEEPIQSTINQNRVNRQTIDFSGFDEISTRADKNIFFIKLSKKHNQAFANFKSSIYQSSKKQLKQISQIFLLEDNKLSNSLDQKRRNDSLEQELIRKIIKQKQQYKRGILPSVLQNYNQTSTIIKGPFSNKSNQKLQGWQDYYLKKLKDRSNAFQIDSTLIGFKNLKEKYLLLKQLDLKTNKKSELLERKLSRYGRNKYFSEQQTDPYLQKSKINIKGQQIAHYQNNNSYLRKTRINQITDSIDLFNDNTPANRKVNHRRQDLRQDPVKKQNQVSNFIRHRKLKGSFVQNLCDNKVYKPFFDKYRQTLNQRQGLNPQKQYVKQQTFCPWQTDVINFD